MKALIEMDTKYLFNFEREDLKCDSASLGDQYYNGLCIQDAVEGDM